MSIPTAVPTANNPKNASVRPGKTTCASVEKRNADNPNPARVIPDAVARDEEGKERATVFNDELSPADAA